MFLILFVILKFVSGNEIPLVGFFHSEHSEQELGFRLAIDRVNQDSTTTTTLIPIIEHVSEFDSFNTSKRVCHLTNEGIGGIIGPHSAETVGVVQSICSGMDIPHLQTLWDISSMPTGNTVNLFPETVTLGQALVEVIEDMDWTSYTIIYEEDEALIRLQELIKSHGRTYTAEGHVHFTMWQLGEEEDQKPLLKEIHNSSETRIILDCTVNRIMPILYQAKEVKMMGEYQSYVLTGLDAHTVDFGEFKFGRTNITTIRLVDPQKHMVQAAVQDLIQMEARKGRRLNLTPDTLKTETALIMDAVNLYAKAVEALNEEIDITPLSCHELTKWDNRILEQIKKMEFEGMTGKVKFDEHGRRIDFSVDVSQLTVNGFRKIGSWDPKNRITYTRTKSEMERELYQSISNKTFIVVSRLDKGSPYLQIKDPNAQGNDRYEGFSMDLIDAIAREFNFKYKFELVKDNNYGAFDPVKKQWNGLIKELRERKADLGICDLTITYERRSAVDFTMPFMPLGISILFSKPVKETPDLFSFLSPLHFDVWIYMATGYLGVSLLLYFLARCTPDEWSNPHPCNPDPTELECTFSLHNCLWFSIGSLMAQGCDLLPKAFSTRVVAGMWWFFVLIMISSYTANLAAFLTMVRMDATIESVEDLAKQNKIKYGVLTGGSTEKFFKNSNESLYQKMWSAMESAKPSVFTKTNDEGVERVLKGKRQYAFFMESTTIEYVTERHCELMQVGKTLDSKGYGIAMPFNSPYRIPISNAVLRLQESRKIKELKDKWWKKGKKDCEQEGPEINSAELGISNVGGVFLVLIGGCFVAFLVAILEFLWNVRKVAVNEKISPKEAFILEFNFAVQCSQKTKPVRHTKEEPDEDEEAVVEKEEYSSFTRMNPYHDDLNVEDND